MGGLPSGMVTFLFTDLVGSTRMWDEQPDAMRVALQRHDAMLRRTIEAHDGQVVKTTGDGVYAVFADAHDAVTAAAALAHAFAGEQWEVEGALQARASLHTGTAEARDGDYFGPTLNRASRLMSAAHGGQVVLSATTAELVRAHLGDDLTLRDLGAHKLRGISRPEHVFQLDVHGLATRFPPLQTVDAFPGRLSLPTPVIVRDDEALAGRAAELDSFERAWADAVDGARQIVLVGGEPGIGKTRIAAEYATRAYERGAVVLYGRCDEEAIVPYQPFVEALRPCVDAYSPSALHERLRGLERDLARVFPDLLGRIPELSIPMPSDPEAERYRLFEAITTLLTGIAAAQPTVLVLDDLQWADKPTLLLLRHVVRTAPRAALLIVVCYRDVELERGHPLADLLADLRREPSVTKVTLGGLSAVESGHLLRRLAGRDLAPSVVTALHDETSGNPFFLEELMRHLVEGEQVPDELAVADFRALGLPESVREVVARRLRRLPETVNDVLDLAAVVGRQFDAVLLGRAADRPVDAVLGALDRAVEAGVLQADPAVIGRYVFAHALIRQTVNAGLGTARRAQLHAAAGRAMEEPNGVTHRAAEIALHFNQALPLVGPEKVIDYTTRAGREALSDFAFEHAAAHFETALRLLEQHGPGDTARRIDLLVDLANALLYVDERAGVDAALEAVHLAREHGTPEQFGQAVAVVAESTYGPLTFPDEVAKLFDEARVLLADREPALRARLLAFEAFKYAGTLLRGRDGRPLAEEAVALARATGDAETLTDALFALAVTLEGSVDVARRIAIGDELVTLGRRGARRAPAFGLRVLARAHLEVGDAAALASAVGDLVRIGEQLRWLPAQAYAAQWRATLATIEGRFDEARACGEELRRFARAYRGAAGMSTMQAFYLSREQGELDGGAPSFASLPETHADNLYTAALIALTHLEAGDAAAAQRVLDHVTSRELLDNEESSRGAVLGVFAEVAATTGPDAAAPAEALLDRLTPYSGRLLCVVLGLGCLGAADRHLAMLHTVLGHYDAAEAYFEQAVTLERRVGGRVLVPRTRYWHARWHLARAREGDDEAARRLLARVASETWELGMARLHAQAVALSR
jgi:class 3 adenylate cyclase/tetratricopeptide (TPR) repeat protein